MIHGEEFLLSTDITMRMCPPVVTITDEDHQVWARLREVPNPVSRQFSYAISNVKDANIMAEYELLRREGVPPARRNAALFMKYM